jgi:hypothetical protein
LGAAAYNHDQTDRLWQRYRQRRQATSESLLGKLKGAWQDLPLESRVIYGIIGVNAGVFGLWRIPALQVTSALLLMTLCKAQTLQM